MKKKTSLLASLLVTLVGCGTEYNDIEYMPVDSNVLGYWSMAMDEGCTLAERCLHDHSNYGNDLYFLNSQDQYLSVEETERATIFGNGVVYNTLALSSYVNDEEVLHKQPRLEVDSNSWFASHTFADEYTVHVRFENQPGTLFSMWNDDELALDFEIVDGVLMGHFNAQQQKIFTELDTNVDWHEAHFVSDGSIVTLTVNCEEVGQFELKGGVPSLSSSPLMFTAYELKGSPKEASVYTGSMDILRISKAAEDNYFCS